MQRREFVVGLGSAAVWPVVARAQPADRTRRVGVLMDTAENNSDGQARIAAFREVLQGLGWTEGRNIQIDYRWGSGPRSNQGPAGLPGMPRCAPVHRNC